MESNFMKIPLGYRLLKWGEEIRTGDMYCDYDGKWKNLNHYIGEPVDLGWSPCITKEKIEKINYTEQQKSFVLKKLNKERAFNGDSAIKVKGAQLSLFSSLAQDGIIETINENRFYKK
jgi:hypothetical protein